MGKKNSETRKRHQQMVEAIVDAGYTGDAETFARDLRIQLSERGLTVGDVPKPKIRDWRRNLPREWL